MSRVEMGKVIRYVVRPRKTTVAGWYVWPVEFVTHAIDCQCSPELGGIEQWASYPYALYPTKQEAVAKAKELNREMRIR